MKTPLKYFFVMAMLLMQTACAQDNGKKQKLQAQIDSVVKRLDGKVGVGVLGLDFQDTLLLNDQHHYPMQSVFKLPLAIFILHQVDMGLMKLADTVLVHKSKLEQHTYSPMLTDFKKKSFYMSVAELLRYSVSKSDNNACDLLFELAGGTAPVDAYFKQHGILDMQIKATEQGMGKHWDIQYTNWCRPSAMLQVLSLLYKDSLLQTSSKAYMMKILIESENPEKRIKGQLPQTAIVAHKTGTSNTNAEGVKAATNDVAIITLPNGKHYALVIYVSDYKGGITVGEKVIADISKAVWDYYYN